MTHTQAKDAYFVYGVLDADVSLAYLLITYTITFSIVLFDLRHSAAVHFQSQNQITFTSVATMLMLVPIFVLA